LRKVSEKGVISSSQLNHFLEMIFGCKITPFYEAKMKAFLLVTFVIEKSIGMDLQVAFYFIED